MARLDKEQWAIIRDRWESDPREGYKWLSVELNISDDALKKRAYREQWRKNTVVPDFVPDFVPMVTNEDKNDNDRHGNSKFKEEYINQAFKLSLLGCTDEEMADVFDVDVRTLNNWKVSHPEFFQSIKRGKTPADAMVATALYDRACASLADSINQHGVYVRLNS